MIYKSSQSEFEKGGIIIHGQLKAATPQVLQSRCLSKIASVFFGDMFFFCVKKSKRKAEEKV
ncbi:hypothetical protein FACS1894111_08180 [Clostridia bacterium]|nr:hypothetical protein FACS1894111_08180 [Clostridia bacterium]